MNRLKHLVALLLAAGVVMGAYCAETTNSDYHPYPKVDKKTGVALPKRASKPIRVTTLDEMQRYMKMDNVYVILEKGEFLITAKDIEAGRYPSTTDVTEGKITHALFLVEGNSSTYDFGGSVIRIEADKIFKSSYFKGEFSDLHILGSHNVVCGVTFIDECSIHNFPAKGCTNIKIDGRENIVDNIVLNSIGSMPYGYGDIFGKGGGPMIKHKKHCGVLVRGDDNTFQNSTIFHDAFGHCLFMQGAVRPNIINNQISSKMTTTEAIFAEKGDPNSKANKVDFMTTWGFAMSENLHYTKAVCEAGIRAYNSGSTIVDGVRHRRKGVDGPYIAGNIVKDTRVGVTLTHSVNATRLTLVEDCVTLGTERGYAINNYGIIRRCASDAKYGPAYGVDYPSGRGNIVDITIVDEQSDDYITSSYDGKKYRTNNGTAHIAYIQGYDHQIKFREGRVADKQKEIYVNCSDPSVTFAAFDLGGHNRTISNIWMSTKDGEYAPETLADKQTALTKSYIANETTLPIRVDENVQNNYIWSVGEVIEEVAGANEIVRGSGWKIDKVF